MLQDYHRYHFLTRATLVSITNVPGRLYTVNPIAINSTFANVLTENKRAICLFDSPEYGRVAFVVVGATMVSFLEVSRRICVLLTRVLSKSGACCCQRHLQ